MDRTGIEIAVIRNQCKQMSSDCDFRGNSRYEVIHQLLRPIDRLTDLHGYTD